MTRDIKHSNGLVLLASYSTLKDNDKEEMDNKMEKMLRRSEKALIREKLDK